MCYNIIQTKRFDDDLKFYVKKRKFSKIMDDIEPILEMIESGELQGDESPELKLPPEMSTYKVRIANSNTKVGKSNGYRLIYYVIKEDKDIYLLTIYYKKDDNRIPSNNQIIELIKEYCT